MINSNKRKLALSGWLKENNIVSYENPLKLQKFLFFYEALIKISGGRPDFNKLRGYEKGPVFSVVWGDYTKERCDFNKAASKSYEDNSEIINEEIAEKSSFIVSTLTEKELSDFTHLLNIWKAKEDRIMKGEPQVSLEESDFNSDDIKLVSTLSSIYPIDMVKNSTFFQINDKYFVFSKSDAKNLTEKHFDILLAITEDEELHNPVFVDIDNEGRLIID